MTPTEFSEWLANQRSGSGVAVTERTAMCISTVYACVALIGGAIASLPLHFYRRGADGERSRYMPEEWWLLNEQPYPCWSAATAWEYATWSLLLTGDSFWRIHRTTLGKVAGFEPLHPATVEVFRAADRLGYRVSTQPALRGRANEATVVLDQDDMLHVAGPGFDGLRGLTQITHALGSAGGIALASDEYSAAFLRNQARPDYALATQSSLGPEQVDNLRNQLSERHGGASRAWKPIVLQGGLEIKPITVNARDSQMIEQRRFQVEDIARIFGVPPFMVGHTEKTTSWGTGIGEMGIQFVKYTLSRHLVKFEQEINRKIFRTARGYCEFLTAGLERGDLKSRYDAYRIGLGRAGEPAFITINEVRRAENLPPQPGGDTLPKPNEGSNEPTAPPAGE